MKNKENALAIVPSFNLTDAESNIVKYTLKDRNDEIFCEAVTVISGWVLMTNVREKKFFKPKMKAISRVEESAGGMVYAAMPYDPNNFTEEGYSLLASRTIPERAIKSVDSYNSAQKEQLPKWAITQERTAVEEANRKVLDYNKKIRFDNGKKFKSLIIISVRNRYLNQFNNKNKAVKFCLRVKWLKWFEQQLKSTEGKELIKKTTESIRAGYEKENIEYDGKLEVPSDVMELFKDQIW